eukprot:TRINITY_DN521_c0_g2_i1.p1 TRINITY_DN521_c0_g2~~TRINITY_DN521_c0_g2_i1.p1  ORF type:complete len:456 (-),score=112.75 TRINITY_DN521_c0_g2_i1:697-2064(-)
MTNLIKDVIMKPSASGRVTRKQQEIAKKLAQKKPNSAEWKVIEAVQEDGSNADLDTEILKLSMGKIDAKKQCSVCGCSSRHSRHCPLKNSRRYVRLKDRRAMQKRLEEHHSSSVKEELKELLATPEKKPKNKKKGKRSASSVESNHSGSTTEGRSLSMLEGVHSVGIQLDVGKQRHSKGLAKQVLKEHQGLDALSTFAGLGNQQPLFHMAGTPTMPAMSTVQAMMLFGPQLKMNAGTMGVSTGSSGSGSSTPTTSDSITSQQLELLRMQQLQNMQSMNSLGMLNPLAMQQLLFQQEQQKLQQSLFLQLQMQQQLQQLQSIFPTQEAESNQQQQQPKQPGQGNVPTSEAPKEGTNPNAMNVEPNLAALVGLMQQFQKNPPSQIVQQRDAGVNLDHETTYTSSTTSVSTSDDTISDDVDAMNVDDDRKVLDLPLATNNTIDPRAMLTEGGVCANKQE